MFRKEQEDIMISILKKCVSLRELVLSDCFLVTGRIMRHLPGVLSILIVLRTCTCTFHLTVNAESLQSFKTINCPNYVKTVANVDLTALPPGLLSLKLANCCNFDDEAFNFFPASLRYSFEISSTIAVILLLRTLTYCSSEN
jgi:hypothetical protein